MNLRPVSKRLSGFPLACARQYGASLIEVLIALVILTVGLLGIALMQVRALSGNNSTMSRSTAVVASYSILETMRSDRANAIAGAYNTTMTGNSCTVTTTAWAQSQLVSWCNDLAVKLGPTTSTIGIIDCGTTGSGVCTVTITFDDSRIGTTAQGGTSAQSVVTKAAL